MRSVLHLRHYAFYDVVQLEILTPHDGRIHLYLCVERFKLCCLNFVWNRDENLQ